MATIISFAVLGVLCLLVPTYFYLSASGSVSIDKFGAFFGSTTGPLLSFLALLAVVANLRHQTKAIEQDVSARMAGEHLRWLDAIYSDLNELLDREIKGNHGSELTFRAMLNSKALSAGSSGPELQQALEDFALLLGQYCEAIAIYRDNCEPLFDVKIYVDRGARLLDLLKHHTAKLGGMSPIMIEIMDMQLRGEKERARPEAMSRRNRN
ncbi:hypothetical protein [Xanthomonas campestris]|uniref:hypothetical protein n=1 Tax=Xanthomonas campestris TaxID=339 RepID=UPI0024B65472|nr:hypothetical protein [Xanthomonas campestris]WHO91447.1 hypothetical protein QMY62_14155 [Xanthomonas campestris]